MISGSRTGGSAGGLRGPQRTKLRRRLPRANDRQLRARVRGFNTPAILAVRGQTRHFERTPFTSGLPQLADILSARRHVSNVPLPGSCPKQRKAYSITSSARAHHAHSGNPAFRRPSVNSFMFDCAPRAIHPDTVNGGSNSSTRAAASWASASRPRWAKADARQRYAAE